MRRGDPRGGGAPRQGGAPEPHEDLQGGSRRRKKKPAREREEDVQDAHEEEEEEEVRVPSLSRQMKEAAQGELGRRPVKQTTMLRFALQVEASGGGQASLAEEPAHVPPQLAGSGLDVISRNSKRDQELEEAQKARQGGREKKKKGHELDPANMDGIKSACWVFFRSAKIGEEPRFVYCLACECLNNGASKNAAARVAITNYGSADAHLHASNAKSHLKQHKDWWRVVKCAAADGLDARAAFKDLMTRQTKREVQGQSTLDGQLKKAQEQPGLVEKELRLVIWMVRNKITFNSIDDIAFKQLQASFGVKLSSGKTLKRYFLLLSEIALRHAENQIREAGMYSIALDYWTSVAKDKYLGITYHYTDKNMKVRARVLDLVAVTGNATALLTSQLVRQCMEKHFEEHRQLFK